MNYRLIICSLQMLLMLSATFFAKAQTADIILINGKIFTADSSKLYVQALAIKGNKIVAAGTDELIRRLATSKTRIINLQGKTAVPGFNQAHEHLGFSTQPTYEYNEYRVEGPSRAAVIDSISNLVKIAKPGQWISGSIGTSLLFDTTMRSSLDSIAPNNPVALQIWWGHGIVANQKALEAAGLTDEDKDPVGGWFIRSQSGKINSIMENAQVPLWTSYYGANYEEQIKALRAYAQEQLKGGFTTVQQMSSQYSLQQSKRFFTDAKLPQRIRIIAWPRSTSAGRQIHEWDVNSELTKLVTISGIKYMIDGTPFEQNSLMKHAYDPTRQWYGRLNYPLDTIRQILKEAATGNRQLMMHIVGDSTVAVVISLMREIAPAEVWRKKRVRIEHNPLTTNATKEELFNLKEMGVLVMHTARYNRSSRIKSLMDNGIMVGMSPDGGATNPFIDIMIVTSQQDNPNENFTREQAVIAYTRTNAFAEFKEKEKGTLVKGMVADIAVLSQDVFTVPTEQLPAIQSVLTIIDGKVVYEDQSGKQTSKL